MSDRVTTQDGYLPDSFESFCPDRKDDIVYARAATVALYLHTEEVTNAYAVDATAQRGASTAHLADSSVDQGASAAIAR
jgi:hypothetical protein